MRRALVAAAGLLLARAALAGCDADAIVRHYAMSRVPQEGVWFSPGFTSTETVAGAALPARFGGRPHVLGSAILGVETSADFSALHRLRTDETWHFYAGDPIDLVLLAPDGTGRRVTLGLDLAHGQTPQLTVPAGTWQGSIPRAKAGKACSFFGTQLAPGFDYADFEIGYRDLLTARYPAFAADIAALTRPEFAVHPSEPAAPTPVAPGIAIDPGALPAARVSPGVELRELVGRTGVAASTRASVALFDLAAGAATADSYNRDAEEIFIVASGSGSVSLGDRMVPVSAGATVFVPPLLRHRVSAAADTPLRFYAISTPAFDPSDYVLVPVH